MVIYWTGFAGLWVDLICEAIQLIDVVVVGLQYLSVRSHGYFPPSLTLSLPPSLLPPSHPSTLPPSHPFKLTDVTDSTTTISDNLQPNTLYWYGVVAQSGYQKTIMSNLANATTKPEGGTLTAFSLIHDLLPLLLLPLPLSRGVPQTFTDKWRWSICLLLMN